MKNQAGGSTVYVVLATIVAALGGLLFGYDTAVVSGAEGFLQKKFQLDEKMIGWVASIALVGCIAGAALAGYLADYLGRKKGLLICALLYIVSGIGTALPETSDQLVWMRILAGMGIGAASMISPLYIAEIAPAQVRGRLVSLYQLAIVLGIFLVFFVNMFIQSLGDVQWNTQTGWRWMFFAGTPPALLFGLAILLVPESPRWLMKYNRRQEALDVLTRVGGSEYAAAEVKQIDVSLAQTQGTLGELFTRYRVPLVMGVLLAVFSQLSGINTVMYYGPRIFEEIGATTQVAFFWTVSVGLVNVVFTLFSFWLIDRAGRKILLVLGTAGQFLSLAAVGWLGWILEAARDKHHLAQTIAVQGLVPPILDQGTMTGLEALAGVASLNSFSPGWPGILLLVFIMLFVASFALGNGVVCWVLISEIFPNRVRGRALSIATPALWATCFLVSLTFPFFLKKLGLAPTFWVYAGLGLVNSIYVFLAVPETRRRTLEEIEASWTKKESSRTRTVCDTDNN